MAAFSWAKRKHAYAHARKEDDRHVVFRDHCSVLGVFSVLKPILHKYSRVDSIRECGEEAVGVP